MVTGTKLSQITISPSDPTPADYVVGVSAGNADLRYSFDQIKNVIPPLASGNLAFYVATTGSDSNPGTLAKPFRTITHAAVIAVEFDYQGLYTPTINVAAGTYVENPVFSNLINVASDASGSLIGAGATTIISANQGFFTAIACVGDQAAAWTVDQIKIDVAGNALFCQGGNLTVNSVTVTDSTESGSLVVFAAEQYAVIFTSPSGTITVEATNIDFVYNSVNYSSIEQLGSLVLPAACTVVAFLGANFFGAVSIFGSITNGGGVTGASAFLAHSGTIGTINGLISDVPGSTAAIADATCAIVLANFVGNPQAGLFFQSMAGIPTTSVISEGTWSVWKDTSGGGLYLIANDGGVIKKVALT